MSNARVYCGVFRKFAFKGNSKIASHRWEANVIVQG